MTADRNRHDRLGITHPELEESLRLAFTKRFLVVMGWPEDTKDIGRKFHLFRGEGPGAVNASLEVEAAKLTAYFELTSSSNVFYGNMEDRQELGAWINEVADMEAALYSELKDTGQDPLESYHDG